MTTELTWLGHGSWSIATGDHTVLLDPFLDDSPTSPVKADAVAADFILVSHGHFDHVSDAVKIARRTGATVIANFEVCQWLANAGVEKTHAQNIGGAFDHPFGNVKMTIAHHSSSMPDGSYGGEPAGFLLTLAEATIYFACDTALFADMKLIGRSGIDLAVVPIGDNFTMGPADSVEAVNLIQPKRVAPAHYNTWPPIEQDAQAWANEIRAQTKAEPVVVSPGGKFSV